MNTVIRVPLIAKPGSPVTFENPKLCQRRKLLYWSRDDAGDLTLYYETNAGEHPVSVRYNLVEIGEVYDQRDWAPVLVLETNRHTWVLLETPPWPLSKP